MIIRKGNISDLPEMRSLFTDTIAVVCKNDYNNDQIDAWKSGAENEERWMQVIEKQLVIVAKVNGQLAGFCTLDRGNYIDLLFVHKDFQHRGIARKMYTFIEQEVMIRKEKKLTAEVSKTAKPFFEKMGFQVITEQTVHVKGIELVNYKMEKELN
ncbi:GNAT family N-acetyltransferase [Chryseobacterium shigense]|uniref:Putative acetyltransferase n=1 Tax=Chryseobacterium shigense TaxID=297244 RepID=A0A1N7IM64_9FLAO|nr:GNAT family N-acetyltransferase [Chryseobacterium shigense]PQA95774.1 GNAT family N-acetyltransferase [Chryseobacterium shigense]SIS38154.1 putative acetyltransferase [Chryseobacterium shigense]